MVSMIQEAIDQGLTQKTACDILELCPRKYRRWKDWQPPAGRMAWNRLRPEEERAIKDAAYTPELMGKPLSHYYVYGHEKGLFYASISTIYRVLKADGLVQPVRRNRKRNQGYVSAHDLLDEGYSLICYDGTTFKTESGMSVIAMPVLLLPCRYLLNIGHSLTGENARDLQKAVGEGLVNVPEGVMARLMAHSDRGSAMKAKSTLHYLEKVNGVPVHFSRPHTPDDSPWIEALNSTMKYHRDAPGSFLQVKDILEWLEKFKEVYNNEPHSSLNYVTPRQALEGKMEVILAQRKENVVSARQSRLKGYYAARAVGIEKCSEVFP